MVPVAKFPTALSWLKDKFLSFRHQSRPIDLDRYFQQYYCKVRTQIIDCHQNQVASRGKLSTAFL